MPFRLGLQPRHADPRTLRFAPLRAPFATLPESWSWDEEHVTAVPVPMFANDQYGDCVIAARAHQTLRFEFQETGTIPPITDKEVVQEYLSESGGADSGLVMLYAMRAWRKGWIAGGKALTIHSFIEVMPQDHDQVKEASMVGLGLQCGVRLPLSAADQLSSGSPWDVVGGPRSAAGSWGGHAMFVGAWDKDGVEFVTWGKKQRATWRWLDAYCDECYLCIDDPDNVTEAIDTTALATALGSL